MAYLNMYSRITIGQVVFNHITSFEITESVTDISDKATITLPRNYTDSLGKMLTDYVAAGDLVTIEAGYNGKLQTEYIGYVSQSISADIPVLIECDELYPLRLGNIIQSYRNVTLKELLKNHITGFEIECPEVELGKVYLDHVSPYQMLEDLRKNFGFYTKVFAGKLLHVGWPYDWQPGFTKLSEYKFGENVKSTSGLKFKHKTDFETKVKVIIKRKDGIKEEIEYGSKDKAAAVSTITVGDMSKEAALQIAKARNTKVSYDGFEGNITGHGLPVVHAGDSIGMVSKKRPERNGRYLAEKVTIRYNEEGFERETKIGFKL